MDKTRECTHMPTPKLHTTVSVSEQVINSSSILDITDVGRLDNTECLFFLFFLVKHTYILTHTLGKGDETREYTHTLTAKQHTAHSVALQVIIHFSISHFTDMG